MGYVPKEVRRRVDFTDTDLEGLEITLKKLSVKALKNIGRLLVKADEKGDGEALSWIDDIVEALAMMIGEWNIEDAGGVPVPPTPGNIADEYDFETFTLPVFMACAKALDIKYGVGDELGKDSPNTPPSVVDVGLPMEVLS